LPAIAAYEKRGWFSVTCEEMVKVERAQMKQASVRLCIRYRKSSL